MAKIEEDIIPFIDLENDMVSDEQLQKQEEFNNNCELRYIIKIKDKEINTLGEIKKYIKSRKHLEKFERVLHDDDYFYLCKWLSFKKAGRAF
jgi:hypothetical protein